MTVCPNCDGNDAADRGDDPWAVARLQTGYVKLSPTQYYRGATFFVAKTCVSELHELSVPERQSHLMEMSEVAAAVFTAFAPRKLNYEALGNSVRHLHWWLTPRHANDARPTGPIWEDMDFLRALWTGGMRPDDATRHDLQRSLLAALEQQAVVIEQAFA
jgi:diadenosine tetraphosphate (Ap4A) HIT family hydrolase